MHLIPAIVVCMLGTTNCITYQLEPVATREECVEVVSEKHELVRGKFKDSWVYGYECQD